MLFVFGCSKGAGVPTIPGSRWRSRLAPAPRGGLGQDDAKGGAGAHRCGGSMLDAAVGNGMEVGNGVGSAVVGVTVKLEAASSRSTETGAGRMECKEGYEEKSGCTEGALGGNAASAEVQCVG